MVIIDGAPNLAVASRIPATTVAVWLGVSMPASHPVPIRAVRSIAAFDPPPIQGVCWYSRLRGNTRSVVQLTSTHLILTPSIQGSTLHRALAPRFRRLPGRQIVSTERTTDAKRWQETTITQAINGGALFRGNERSRSAILATFIPNRIFEAPAMAAIAASVSRLGSFDTNRSVCQIESIPASSQ